MIKYRNTEEHQKLMQKISQDSSIFFSLSSNFPNSEDFKKNVNEVISSYNAIVSMANSEIRELQAKLNLLETKSSVDDVQKMEHPEIKPTNSLEDSLKSQIIEAALSKYTLGELWEKLK